MIGSWEQLGKLIDYTEEGITSKELIRTGMNNVTLFSMSRGTEMSEHTSSKEGFVYVLEGDGTFSLEGEDIKMAQGVLIYMKRNAKHSLSANKNTSFILSLR